MKKYICFFILVVSVISLCACGKNNSTTDSEVTNISLDSILQSVSNNSGIVSVEASYNDGIATFDELVGKSSCIIVAKVEETMNKSALSQTAVLKVEKIIFGQPAETITLVQFAGDNNVKVGESYLLFLGNQTSDELDSQKYYPIAGGIGVMNYYDDLTSIKPIDSRVDEKELQNWLLEKKDLF